METDLAESLEFLVGLDVKKHDPVMLATHQFGDRTVYDRAANSVSVLQGPKMARRYRVGSIYGMKQLLSDIGSDKTRVFVSESRVIAVLDETSDRREGLEMALKPSAIADQFASHGRCQMVPHALWTWLRTESESVSPPDFMNQLRKITIKSDGTVKTSVGTGEDSFGKEISQKATGDESPLPDDVTLCFHWYTNVLQSALAEIVCTLDFDFERSNVLLKAKAGEVEAAQSGAILGVAGLLKSNPESDLAHEAQIVSFVEPNVPQPEIDYCAKKSEIVR